MASPNFTGVTVAGVKPALLRNVMRAAMAVGATSIHVTSAKREPGLAHNDVRNSNHITGDALDGYAIIDGQQVPLGQAILHVASKYGLRSGDVKGFDPKTLGGYDPIHIDDGFNVGGVKGGASIPAAPVSAPAPIAAPVAPAAPAPVAKAKAAPVAKPQSLASLIASLTKTVGVSSPASIPPPILHPVPGIQSVVPQQSAVAPQVVQSPYSMPTINLPIASAPQSPLALSPPPSFAPPTPTTFR